MIAVAGIFLLAIVLAAMLLAVFAIHLEDRRASIREQKPSGRLVAACRRVTGLYVHGLPADTEEQDSNKEVQV